MKIMNGDAPWNTNFIFPFFFSFASFTSFAVKDFSGAEHADRSRSARRPQYRCEVL